MRNAGTVALLKPNMRLDLGGIAKGYAVDQALVELKRLGIARALVNASGDMSASGPPPGKPGWVVGVAPLEPSAPPSVFGYLAQSIDRHVRRCLSVRRNRRQTLFAHRRSRVPDWA